FRGYRILDDPQQPRGIARQDEVAFGFSQRLRRGGRFRALPYGTRVCLVTSLCGNGQKVLGGRNGAPVAAAVCAVGVVCRVEIDSNVAVVDIVYRQVDITTSAIGFPAVGLVGKGQEQVVKVTWVGE